MEESKNVLKIIEEQKLRFTDKHTQKTFWIENEIAEKLDKYGELGGKGTISRLVNQALKEFLK